MGGVPIKRPERDWHPQHEKSIFNYDKFDLAPNYAKYA